MKGLKGQKKDLGLYPMGNKAPMEGFCWRNGQVGLCFGRSCPAEYSKGGLAGVKMGEQAEAATVVPENEAGSPAGGRALGEKDPCKGLTGWTCGQRESKESRLSAGFQQVTESRAGGRRAMEEFGGRHV